MKSPEQISELQDAHERWMRATPSHLEFDAIAQQAKAGAHLACMLEGFARAQERYPDKTVSLIEVAESIRALLKAAGFAEYTAKIGKEQP